MSFRTFRRRTRVLTVAALALAAAFGPASNAAAQGVTGSGSTFVKPLLNRWSQDYLRSQWTAESQSTDGLDYERSARRPA